MADLKNKYGQLLYRIEGNSIKDVYGNWKYEIRENYIFDTYGNRLFEIRGEELYDTYGKRLGEMKNLVDFLEPPGDSNQSSPSSYNGGSSSGGSGNKELSGWAIVALLFLALWHFLAGPFVAFSLLHEPSARKEWWGTFGRSIGLSFLFLIIITVILGNMLGDTVVGWASLVVLIIGLIPIIVVSIRRMHDIGKRGWWILIPLVNFVMCGFFRGKTDGNPFL